MPSRATTQSKSIRNSPRNPALQSDNINFSGYPCNCQCDWYDWIVIQKPIAGADYPSRIVEMRAWFPTDAACLDYLDWLRWPDGFMCPFCEATRGTRTEAGTYRCGWCMRRISVTAGTIFERSRTPMTVWFEAAWLMTVQRNGTSATNLAASLPVGSYQTVWTMMGKLRSAMSTAEKSKLSGIVEVDEWMHGGVRPGQVGRGVGKNIVIAAVETRQSGRVRFAVIPDAKIEALQTFISAHIEPGSTVITDGWKPYVKATDGYIHQAHNESKSPEAAHTLLPAVHKVFSLADRWLLGTHQGGVKKEHLQEYLDEYTFRYNRRNARERGLLFFRLLEHALSTAPVTYRDLVRIGAPKPIHPIPPRSKILPGTLEVPAVISPWRNHKTVPL